MNISKRGIDLIKQFEGFANTAYEDTGGVWTIGYGTIKYPNGQRVKQGDACSIADAEEYLKNDVQSAVHVINLLQFVHPLSQNQFDALVSFQYNTGGLSGSTLYKKAKVNPEDETIYKYNPINPVDSCEFLRWVRDNGKVINGLRTRRMKEADLYADPL